MRTFPRLDLFTGEAQLIGVEVQRLGLASPQAPPPTG